MSLKSQKLLLKNGAPLPGTGLSTSSLDGASRQREELEKILSDVFTLSQRIAEAKGEPVPTRDASLTSDLTASPFVSSLRALADAERRARDVKEQKIHALESLLEKVSEYNRLVLAKTAPPELQSDGTTPVRRKSFGTDLASLPSHLRLIDRLFDLHTQSKRVTVLRTTDALSLSAPPSAKPAGNEAELQHLREELRSCKERCDALQEQNRALSDRQALSSHQLSTAESQQKDLTALRDALQVRCDKLAAENAQLLRQQADVTAQNEQLRSRVDQAQLAHDASQRERQQLEDQLSVKTQQLAQAAAVEAPRDTGLEDKLHDEIESLKRQLSAATAEFASQLAHTELRHSTASSCFAAFVEAVRRCSALLAQTELPLSALAMGPEQESLLTEEQRSVLAQLRSAVHSRLQGLQREVALLLQLKEGLEGDVASANLQRDMLQADFVAVQEQHDALKAAYHSQSYELATRGSGSAQQSHADAEELRRLNQEVATLRDTVRTLENSLQLQKLQLRTLEQWPALVADLEAKVDSAAREKLRLEYQLTSAQSELTETQKLVASLRDKVRDLCSAQAGSTNSQANNWSDTYEEVMQEELQAMKVAFESKLRAARDEADALARRHQQEIARLQQHSQHSSFAALPKLSTL